MADTIPTEYAAKVAYLQDKANKGTLLSNDQILTFIVDKANKGVKPLQAFLITIQRKIIQV